MKLRIGTREVRRQGWEVQREGIARGVGRSRGVGPRGRNRPRLIGHAVAASAREEPPCVGERHDGHRKPRQSEKQIRRDRTVAVPEEVLQRPPGEQSFSGRPRLPVRVSCQAAPRRIPRAIASAAAMARRFGQSLPNVDVCVSRVRADSQRGHRGIAATHLNVFHAIERELAELVRVHALDQAAIRDHDQRTHRAPALRSAMRASRTHLPDLNRDRCDQYGDQHGPSDIEHQSDHRADYEVGHGRARRADGNVPARRVGPRRCSKVGATSATRSPGTSPFRMLPANVRHQSRPVSRRLRRTPHRNPNADPRKG